MQSTGKPFGLGQNHPRQEKVLLVAKAEALYNNWLKQQSVPVEEGKKLKFSDRWVADWMSEYNVSLQRPNKRFSIKQEDR